MLVRQVSLAPPTKEFSKSLTFYSDWPRTHHTCTRHGEQNQITMTNMNDRGPPYLINEKNNDAQAQTGRVIHTKAQIHSLYVHTHTL